MEVVRKLVYNTDDYWCGDKGYRPPGYRDFTINTVKEICIMIEKPRSLLDIGCAYGYTVGRMLDLDIPAKGIDISSLAISRAPQWLQGSLVEGVLWDMPFKDKEFDYGYSSGVLEHIPQDKLEKTISEIKRVCNRGLIGVAIDKPTEEEGEDDTHCTWLSLEEWRKLFEPNFKVISDSESSWRITASLSVYKGIWG